MKHICAGAGSGALVTFLTVATSLMLQQQDASAIVFINFDERPGLSPPYAAGTPLTAEHIVHEDYLELGVVFDSAGGGISIRAPGNPVSAPNVAGGTEPGPVLSFSAPVTANFFDSGMPTVVSVVALELTSTSAFATLSAYDLSGILLGSTSGGGGGPTALTVTFTEQIHSVVLSGSAFAFDNFSFDGLVPVPEPSALSIAAIGGVIALARVQRRGRGSRW